MGALAARRLVFAFLVATAAVSSGCKSGNRTKLRDAIVPASEADKAYGIVERTRAYLPYEYSPDGCYARATYMQMELFAANVPSRVVFIRTAFDVAQQTWADNAPLLEPGMTKDKWVYHVAPVIKVDGQEMVLDPGLEPESKGGALHLDEWLGKMKALKFIEAPSAELNRKVSDSVGRFVLSRAGNPDAGPIDSANVRGQVIHSTSEMPSFGAESMMWNFKTMDKYLMEAAAMNGISVGEMASRRGLLAARTLELSDLLEGRNMTSGPGGDLEGIKLTMDMLRSIQTQNETEFAEEQSQRGNGEQTRQ